MNDEHNITARMTVLFMVEDSGIGIKEEDFSKLFKFFGKLKQNSNVNQTGIGLGLTICNKILNQFGSELKVQSKYGQGSKFSFMIDLPYMIKERVKFSSS